MCGHRIHRPTCLCRCWGCTCFCIRVNSPWLSSSCPWWTFVRRPWRGQCAWCWQPGIVHHGVEIGGVFGGQLFHHLIIVVWFKGDPCVHSDMVKSHHPKWVVLTKLWILACRSSQFDGWGTVSDVNNVHLTIRSMWESFRVPNHQEERDHIGNVFWGELMQIWRWMIWHGLWSAHHPESLIQTSFAFSSQTSCLKNLYVSPTFNLTLGKLFKILVESFNHHKTLLGTTWVNVGHFLEHIDAQFEINLVTLGGDDNSSLICLLYSAPIFFKFTNGQYVRMNEILSRGYSCDMDWEYCTGSTGAAESGDSDMLL